MKNTTTNHQTKLLKITSLFYFFPIYFPRIFISFFGDMKLRIIKTLILSLLLFLGTVTTSNANMLNKFKKGFYFEKYKTPEEAKSVLLELHPIGSDVNPLIKTLERARARLSFFKKRKDFLSNFAREREYFYEGVSNLAVITYGYDYEVGLPIINSQLWRVIIFCDKERLITNINAGKDYIGL